MHPSIERLRNGSRLGVRSWTLTLILVLLVGLVAIPAFAQPDHKRFAAEFSATGPAAEGVNIAVEITNQARQPQTIGSAEIYPPDGVTLTAAVDPAVLNDDRNVIELRDLDLPRRASRTFHFTVDECTDGEWGIAVKQSNDFQGTGNDFALSTADSQLVVDCGGPVECDEDDGDCTLTLTGQNMTLTFSGTVKDGAGSGMMTAELRVADTIACDGGADVDLDTGVEAFFFDADGMEAPIRMTMTVEAASDDFTPRSASDYQLCWLGEDPFHDRNGTLIDDLEDGFYGPAYAQGCPASPDDGDYGDLDETQFPCGLNWVNEVDGTRTITYLLPAKDPIGAWK